MFDQLMKRSDAVWIYTTGRFAEERRAFLCEMSKGGRSLLTLRNVNKLLLYAETDLEMKAKALAACDPGGGRRQKKWRDDPSLMEFLRKL